MRRWSERTIIVLVMQTVDNSLRVVRRRGLFEAAVYRVKLDVSGDFVVPDPATWAPKDATILWDTARALLEHSHHRDLNGHSFN